MKETWKDITGYEKCYQISDLGRVKSLDRIDRAGKLRKGKIIKPFTAGAGYLKVFLSKDGKAKQFYVHRLVAESFLKRKTNEDQVNHKDENKQNNSLNNLEWCTPKYNLNYGNRLKAYEKPIVSINRETGKIIVFKSMQEAARKGFNQSAISRCCRKIDKSHLNCLWFFKSEFNKVNNINGGKEHGNFK